MNTQPEPAEDFSALSEEEKALKLKEESDKIHGGPKEGIFSYPCPNLILSKDRKDVTIRQGGKVQVTIRTEANYSFSSKEDAVFRVLRPSYMNMFGKQIECLDDKSIPTAKDYADEIGKEVLYTFNCRELPSNGLNALPDRFGKPVYVHHHVYLTIPQNP